MSDPRPPLETLRQRLVRLRWPILMMLPGTVIGLSLLLLMVRAWPTEMAGLAALVVIVGSGVLFLQGLDRTIHEWDD